jgi:hypothetical protein
MNEIEARTIRKVMWRLQPFLLPDATRETLWKKHKSELAFPAGFPLD